MNRQTKNFLESSIDDEMMKPDLKMRNKGMANINQQSIAGNDYTEEKKVNEHSNRVEILSDWDDEDASQIVYVKNTK